MKKSLITLALLVASAGASASSQPLKAAATAAPASGATPPVATVNVSGATTVAGAPLLLSLNGAPAVEPTFQQLFEAGSANPTWKVTKVTLQGPKARLAMKSTSSADTIEMDVSARLASDLKVKKDVSIAAEVQSSGQGALVKFTKDHVTLGFVVNKSTKVIQRAK